MTTRRRPSIRLLNPFARFEQRMADDRLASAIQVVEGIAPDLRDREPGWFGGSLEGDTRARYVAVAFTAAPHRGLAEGRAFVVDIRTGHVVWQRPIDRRADLPRHVAVLAP